MHNLKISKNLARKLCFYHGAPTVANPMDPIVNNKAPALEPGDGVVKVDLRYFHPTEVEKLLGDPNKAKQVPAWESEINVSKMRAKMVAEDLNTAQRHALLKKRGQEVAVAMQH